MTVPTMETASVEAWQRLAELLVARRVELRRAWSNRQAFCRDTGAEYRIVHDLENAKRTNYSASTLALIEKAYTWQPGSIRRVLSGGNPNAGNEAGWNPRAMTGLLRRLQEPPARLSPRDIATMAGISRPQVYRWLQGENRPQYDALRHLGMRLELDCPHAGVTTGDLIQAAGYEQGAPSSATPVAHGDAQMAHQLSDALEHGVGLDAWDLSDTLEREIFLYDSLNWTDRTTLMAVLRALKAQTREREGRSEY